jgi:hypothetical protein
MNTFLKWAISAIVLLLPPVFLWNVWFLDYINQHGKLLAWILTPVWPLLAAAIFVGLSSAKDKVAENGFVNPFWGWFGVGLVINIFITAASNS